jgi:cytochrome c2
VADSPDAEAIVKKEPESPQRDPIVSRSTSGILLVCALLLMGSLAWALYDEVYGQRAWKGVQQEFVKRYNRYLRRQLRNSRNGGPGTEKEIRETEEFKKLDEEAKQAAAAVEPERKDIDRQVAIIQSQLDAITDPFQNARGYISVLNYRIETASSDSSRNSLRQQVAGEKQKKVRVEMPVGDGSDKTQRLDLTYPELEDRYTALKDKKGELLTRKAELLKKPAELAKERDDYLKENVTGLTDDQIRSLIKRNENFDYSLRQISVLEHNIVDRCETCHLGVREPVRITAAAMAPSTRRKPDALAHASVSHPNKELLQIHNPERFGCSSCHGGNGRATTTVIKAHGQNPFWLHPLWARENMEAGCQQCHSTDRVLDHAPTLTQGKDLFQNRGCVGCHRYEGYDRESDALSNARQTIKQLEEQIATNERESRLAKEESGAAENDVEAQRLLARAESMRVTNSLLAAQIEQLNTTSKYLMQDQKKVGPNLKDVRLKLRKEWIPEWLRDPQAFRPGTKMPTFWRIDGRDNRRGEDNTREDEERKAIAAFIWQEGFDGRVPERQKGDAAHGKELFETRGCMACHSIGEGDQLVGGENAASFAANLTRVGDKASYDYIVRWIYNPRERWAPYCPKEKRDLTREDYERNGKPFVFDGDHSKCPNDGAEIQVQNMTVMPNFRLTEKDAEDIATYLFSLSERRNYPDASFMDDPALKDKGRALVRTYGCAGCHEIKGLEEEQRIGKELSAEGATPIERFDFALLTKPAEDGLDPYTNQPVVDKRTGEKEDWYNAHGFISHKINDPGIYDKGKEKEPKDMLRMPKPFMTEEWNRALTTFLIGSVGVEGANVPQALFYTATDRQKDIQDGWWVVKKYNCMGCHSIQVGQPSVLMGLPLYQSSEWRDQLPPRLTSEGARVDPDWLLRFLRDPSLSDEHGRPAPGRSDKTVGPAPGNAATGNQYSASTGTSSPATGTTGAGGGGGGQDGAGGAGQNRNAPAEKLKPQPGMDRNGVRPYLKARMPTFSFSPQELRTLVRFFMAVSAQQEPYIPEKLEPLTEQERNLARQLFTSRGAPCLKCHITGEPEHDKTALAPNFLLASERLKPGWTFRWILDPQQISPGTAMPSGLFKKDQERWVFSGETPPAFNDYHGDHADLLVRYMFELTADEQRRLASTSPPATSGQTPAPRETESATPAQQGVSRASPSARGSKRRTLAYNRPAPMRPAAAALDRVAVAHQRRLVNFSP